VNNPLDKTMTTDKHCDSTPGYGQTVNNYPKRYTLGSKHYWHEVVPCMIEHPEGKYVLFAEYQKLAAHNQYCEALIAKLRGDKQSPQGPSSRLFGGRS
jgi:hypothetical protein|tara:strand:- start:54610 stop:54903 length:294 start_codon:yes stop_codon:yes gene_type:complete